MTSLRVFVSAVGATGEHQEAQVAVQLMKDLRDAGAEVVADDGTVPDAQFLPFLQQELPTCQWLVFIQTVESCRSLRAQAVIDMALQQEQQPALPAVLRIVCPSATAEQEPDAWSHTSAYAFWGDYPRLRAKVFLALNLSSRDDATRPQGRMIPADHRLPSEGKNAAPLPAAHQESPTPPASPGQHQDDIASYDRPRPLSRGRSFASRWAHLWEKQPVGEEVAQYDRPAHLTFMKYRRYRTTGITAGAIAAGFVITAVLATLLVSPKPPPNPFKAPLTPSGPPSNTVQAAPSMQMPDAPTNLVAAAGNGAVMLSWSPPAPGLWYWIYWRDTSTRQKAYTRSVYPLTSGTTFTLTYLTNGNTYQFYVTAINARGESPPSRSVLATPMLPLPSAPTGLSASANTNGSITLSWTAPAPGLWYWIYWRDTSTRQKAYTRSVYPLTSGTTFTLTYLTNGNTYQFYVTAINLTGEGPASNVAQATSR